MKARRIAYIILIILIEVMCGIKLALRTPDMITGIFVAIVMFLYGVILYWEIKALNKEA